ncbi:MAG: cytochrome b5 domain-containing protein [Actinomycetales bacterium]|jgi:cytochrome b involved in lipid metabolism|nr:cytochrome b5 domain-containing protein [Actinomycetales bacterium]
MPFFASDSGLFDTISGLPVHPLVVHVAVIVLPLSALAFVAIVLVRRLRRSYGWLTLLGLFAGTAAAVAAKESGEALAKRVGTPATHASYGDLLPLIGAVLAIVALVWMVMQRQSARRAAGAGASGEPARDSGAVKVLGAAGIVAAGATLVMTVLVGHSGAEAVWGNRIASTTPAAASSTPSATSAAPSTTTATPSTSAATTAAAAPTSTAPATTAGGYTLAQVQQHATASSCWTVVSGGVYDVTSWIAQHPGGSGPILGLCGKDGTAAFAAQHGTVGRAVNELKQFKIGSVA